MDYSIEQRPAELRSVIRWRAHTRRQDHLLPDVLYFQGSQPEGFTESGLYIGFRDFKDVQREQGIQDVPLTTLYHNLVLHFARNDRRLLDQAVSELRYNPANQASWSEDALTYDYHLRTGALVDYSNNASHPEYKIEGIARVGNRVIKAVLEEASDEVVFGGVG